MTTVALLGTGTMGAGMARSMLRAGLDVRAWNRTRDKAEPLAADGAVVADTATDAVTGADVVVVMLYDADSVVSVLTDAAAAAPDAVWVQSSTVGLDGTARIADVAEQAGLALLDAPVLGTKGPAEQGALVVLASGDPALRERAQPVFDAIGSRTIWVGDTLGLGSGLKLACNAWVATITAGTAQSLAIAAAVGVDPELFLDAIEGTATDSKYAHVKGAQMLQGQFPASFALDGVRKDLGLISAAAQSAGVRTSVLAGVDAAFDAASAAGHGADDMAAVHVAFTPAS